MPIFAEIDTLCQNSPAPLLPTVSTNGVTGSWDPSIIETSISGNFIYRFTPDPWQCALEQKMEIFI